MAASSLAEAAEDELQKMIKTDPEQEDNQDLPVRGHVPAVRDPVVPLTLPASGQQPLAWSPDHRLSVCTASSLSIMELQCDVHTSKQHMMLLRTSIPVPAEPCIMRVGPSAELAKAMQKFSSHRDRSLRQLFLTDRVIHPSVGTRKGIKHASWSPLGCDATGRCLLACLTLENRLSIHHSVKRLEWNLLVDLTKKYGELLKERGYATKDNKPPEANLLDFKELQRRFRMQTPVRMEWSSKYTLKQVQPDSTCVDVEMVLLAVLMENGDLVLWKFLLPFTNGKDVLFFDLIESGVTQPSDLAWWEYKSEDRQMSGLIIGSEEGPLKIMPVHLKSVKGYFTLRHPVILWKECDNIAVANIRCIPLMHSAHKASCSLIVASRGCYIFWCLLGISSAGMNVHNSHIAGLHSLSVASLTVDRQSMALYSCSTDGWIKKLTPVFQGNSLTFKQEDMPQVENLTGRRIHGIAVSPNGAYIALLSTQGLVGKHHPTNRTYQVHFVTLKAANAAAELLLTSPSQNLYKMMDLLDLVRWHVLKNRCIPTWLQEALDQKLQEADVPYLWRFKLFLARVLYQTVQSSPGIHTWKPRPKEAQIAEENDGEGVRKEGEAVEIGESESELAQRVKEAERRAELQSSIQAAEAHLLRGNMKKVLGVVYLNTSNGQNTSIPTCGLMEYLSRDVNDRASEVLIGHIKNKMNKQAFSERCALCQAVLPFTDHKDTTCENGHLWPRCVLSYQACQALTFRRCLLLDSIARLPEPEDPEWIKKILQMPCMLCDSPLMEN